MGQQINADDTNGPIVIPMPSVAEAEKKELILPFNIGIAPPTPIQGMSARILDIDGKTVDKLTWPRYLAWRKTKCRPYDYDNGPKLVNLAVNDAFHGHPDNNKARALEEIDQAIHEFVGEIAELGELIINYGPAIFYSERDKLIDEIGDILFCGAWVMDAWGVNPLYAVKPEDGLEFIEVDKMEELKSVAETISESTFGEVSESEYFMHVLGSRLFPIYSQIASFSGLLCNSFKKLRWQRREQDVNLQSHRVFMVFMLANQILGMAGATVEDALRVNMRKLDARRPGGYDPTKPGGIREGAGR